MGESEAPPRPQKSVVDGKPTYTSASSLRTADECPRKWYFAKVMGIKVPPTKSQAVGTKVHSEIEHYLKTGELTLGQIAMAGKHLIPEPDENHLIERRIWAEQIALAGIPLEGYIDLVCPVKGLEIIDWKTTSNLKWAKSGLDLRKDIQMMIYAKWGFEYYGETELRLSHVYFQTKGRPQAMKSTTVVSREHVEEQWQDIERIARNLHTYAALPTIDDVRANREACDNYGGCPFYDKCPRGMGETLMSVLDQEKVPGKFKIAWAKVVDAGRGVPPIDGQVAQWVGILEGGSGKLESRGGEGELGALPSIHDPATIYLLADELEAEAKAKEPEPPAVLPPEAPESKPELAAVPVPKDLPPGVLDMTEAKKLKKADLLEAYEHCLVELVGRLPEPGGVAKPEGMKSGVSIKAAIDAVTPTPTIYVNCLPADECPRLEPYVFHTAQKLAQAADAQDIRCSNNDALAFGKWKGALTAAVIESPPPGSYTITCKGDELAEIVVAACEGSHRIVRGY